MTFMFKLQRIFSISLLLGVLLLLSGCDIAVLNPHGLIAAAEKKLFITAVLLMLVIVVPVIILTFVFAHKYRAGNKKAKYSPDWGHSTMLEMVCWGIPLIIIIILAVITMISTYKLDPYRPLNLEKKPLTIQVISLNWRWLFIYPEQKIATINFVQFPVDTPIKFVITSDAPMNSFQIPQLAGQIYAMAGMQTKLHLIADKIGDYRGASTNFSGEGFSDMNFVARVSSQNDFAHWVRTIKQSPDKLTLMTYNKLVPDSADHGVHQYSLVTDNLFETVIMKYMMPQTMNNSTHHTTESTMMGMPLKPNPEKATKNLTAGMHHLHKNSTPFDAQ